MTSTVPIIIVIAPSGLGRGTVLPSEKARLGTAGTKAKYVLGNPSLSGCPLWFFLSIQSVHALANLAGEKYSSKLIDPEAKVTNEALKVQMVDVGASAGWQKRG